MSIYRSSQGKDLILSLYDKNWESLGLDTERRSISTRYGNTHVVVAGPKEALPIVVFHGGNMISPISFAWIRGLTGRYRIYAPDTVGHPGYSAGTRLKPGTWQYGEWASDVIDGLGLEKPIAMGGSYGAGILLNLAAYAPSKIGKAVLVVPSGFAPPPLFPLAIQIGVPMILYTLTHAHQWLVRSLWAMCPDPADNVVEITGAVYRHLKLEPEMPRSIQKEDLKDFQAPTLVLAAENDILFPPKSTLQRAREVIPNLAAAEVIAGSTHFVPERLWDSLCQRIDRFLQQGA